MGVSRPTDLGVVQGTRNMLLDLAGVSQLLGLLLGHQATCLARTTSRLVGCL